MARAKPFPGPHRGRPRRWWAEGSLAEAGPHSAGAAPCPSDVLLLTAAFGSGHRQVAEGIAEGLRELAPGVRVAWADYADALGRNAHRAVLAAYAFSIRHWPQGWEWFYRATARVPSGTALHGRLHGVGRGHMGEVLRRASPRIAICTYPEEGGMLSDLRRRGLWHGPTVVVVTDHAAHSQWIYPMVDAYCVPTPEVAAGMAALGAPPDRLHVTGIPLRASFAGPSGREEARERLGFGGAAPVALVMPGAFGDPAPALQAARVLLRPGQGLQVAVVAGEDRAVGRVLAALGGRCEAPPPGGGTLAVCQAAGGAAYAADAARGIHVFGRVERMATLMRAADLMVGKAGGVTTAEALACGLPMLLFRPLPGQERANARYLCERGAAWLAPDRSALAAGARELLGRPGALAAMREACSRLARPRAARDVAALALARIQPSRRGAAG